MTSDVRFRGKADIAYCDANVCFEPICDMDHMELLPCNLTPRPPFADGKSLL
jgi:hypothetical protein